MGLPILKIKSVCLPAFLLAIAMVFAWSPLGAAQETKLRKIEQLVQNGAVVMMNETGRPLVRINADKMLVPASIIKIPTAMVALDNLGADYRFLTGFYKNDRGDLAVKGFGDPFVVSDEIRLMAQALINRGVRRINRIVLDHSHFAPNQTIPGLSQTANPYDALNDALVVNFNTIFVKKELNGAIASAEPETPLTPTATRKAAALPRGRTERINLSADSAECRRYAGELFAAIFREQGIVVVETAVGEAAVDGSWQEIYMHRNSRPLMEMLRNLLEYSNNFIANQIFLTIPQATGRKAPATLQASRQLFAEQLRSRQNIEAGKLVMVEGSGISRENRATAEAMITLLERFRPHAELLAPKNGHLVKSGTLMGVYNYAGYIKTGRGLRPFVIMLNQTNNHRDALLKLLASL